MADDFTTIAVAQPSSMSKAANRCGDVPFEIRPAVFADRAERGVELLSRWVGIAAFAAAVAAIAWMII